MVHALGPLMGSQTALASAPRTVQQLDWRLALDWALLWAPLLAQRWVNLWELVWDETSLRSL